MRSLEHRFAEHVRSRDLLRSGESVGVALSGGRDSCVLLHLLRFHPPVPDLGITAVHVDHGMRAASAADAEWVRGLCRAWNVPVVCEQSELSVASETGAREIRYRILQAVRSRLDLQAMLTAHHADDQAETVLFRALRGTGVAGLAGIRATRPDAVRRPLLPFHGEAIEAYAGTNRIRSLRDPTNRDLRIARNRIRHRILPEVERTFAPGARRALARLAGHAADLERAVDKWVEAVAVEVVETPDPDRTEGGMSLDRARLLALPQELRALVLRSCFHRLGIPLDSAGTRSLLEFTSRGASGRSIRVSHVRLSREFDRFVVGERAPERSDSVLLVASPGNGEGGLHIGGARFTARWSVDRLPDLRWVASFPIRHVPFPLQLRSWRPGDRIRMAYGTKKLKKLFGERRVGVTARTRLPVLVDGNGRVLWVAGVARADVASPSSGAPCLHIGIGHAQVG